MAKNSTSTNGWFHSERQICQDYKPHYNQNYRSGQHYDDCKRYLDIVGEDGRKPLTGPMIIGLMFVLFLEAFGFSYTMSGFIDLSASEDTRQVMSYILAFGFAIALALVTHSMGAEIHRNRLIESVRLLWKADRDPEPQLTAQVGDRVGRIDNPSDMTQKPYIQRLNRLKLGSTTKKYHWSIATIVVVIVIATTLTYIRVKAMESAMTMDTICKTQMTQSESSFDFSTLDGDAGTLAIDPDYNRAAIDNGTNEACNATEAGSWATFGIMAILFALLQAFATWVSMNFGFAGKLSREAYDYTHKFATREEFIAHYEVQASKVADYAQKSLTRLQTRMAKKLPDITQSTEVTALIATAEQRSFHDFLQWEKDQELERSLQEMSRTIQADQIKKAKRQASTLTDEEMREQLLAEHCANVAQDQEARIETEEEQRARLMKELGIEG